MQKNSIFKGDDDFSSKYTPLDIDRFDDARNWLDSERNGRYYDRSRTDNVQRNSNDYKNNFLGSFLNILSVKLLMQYLD